MTLKSSEDGDSASGARVFDRKHQMNESQTMPDLELFKKSRYCEMCDVWFKLVRTVWCPHCGMMTVKSERVTVQKSCPGVVE